MNRVALVILAWALLGLELGFKSALELGATGVAPSFIIPLAVFVALSAPPIRTLWACLILGLLLDLTSAAPMRSGAAGAGLILGPWALGMVLSGQLVLALRGMMIRRNPLTMGFLSFLACGVAQIVVVALLTAHHLFHADLAWRADHELWRRLLAAVYTGVLGFVMALALIPAAPFLGASLGQQRFPVRR